jgi:bacillithiol biosynthesis cysteine-adding enzyme BshC
MLEAFTPSFLAQDPHATVFLSPSHSDPSLRRKALHEAASRRVEPAILDALDAMEARLAPSTSRRANLEALSKEGTSVVVTGQQIGLFLGPLYTFSKALSAIQMAKRLEEESGKRVVPLFWLQTEDHDLAEIATCAIPSQDGDPKILRLLEDEEAKRWRASVEHYRIPEASLLSCLQELESSLGHLPHAKPLIELLRDAYTAGRGMAEAFAFFLSAIFAQEGLLILDPRQAVLAPLAAKLHRRAIFESAEIERRLQEREKALEEAGFRVQIPHRPQTLLSFYHPEGIEGGRYRLLRQTDGFALAGHEATFSKEDIEEALSSKPLCFSTSALLRPLLQDSWLPTAAYLGGPGEIAYFAQLAPLYAWLERPMPMILPRGHFQILERSTQKALEHLGLQPHDLQAPEAALLERLSAQDREHPLALQRLRNELSLPLQKKLLALHDPITALDPTLAKPLQKMEAQIEDLLEKFFTKIQRVRLSQDDTTRLRLRHAQGRLYPQGIPQERLLSFLSFAASCGILHLKEAFSQAYLPFSAVTQRITL